MRTEERITCAVEPYSPSAVCGGVVPKVYTPTSKFFPGSVFMIANGLAFVSVRESAGAASGPRRRMRRDTPRRCATQ
jgi:hypothetical protein